MRQEDLCRCDKREYEYLKRGQKVRISGPWHAPRPIGIKRKRMVCGKCKRRLWSSVIIDDGFEIIHSIPPHKPKKWWKKRKEKKT